MPNQMAPVALARALGQSHAPTTQQAGVIGAPPGPLLVVAGAGAGKTETMAARVVWLVANGYARPEEILGLTFTRKAAQELGKRIRDRLSLLAADDALVRRLDPSGELASSLTVIAPTVSTYDAYAGDLIREYGLLVPVEPDARLITDAELHAIATEVVLNHSGGLIAEGGTNPSLNTVVDNLLGLTAAMGNELAAPGEVAEAARVFIAETESLPRSARSKTEFSQKMAGWRAKQQERAAYLPLAAELAAELRRRGVVTFNEQMSVAAGLARDHESVGQSQRARYRVVMLDEYQDTSHAQRVLLRSLFGGGVDPDLTVTAVGDPMQAIYGWRGATAANLEAFVEDFPRASGEPAPKMQLTTSWRNPPEVLGLANHVSDAILGTGPGRAVEQLQPREGAGVGDVTLGFFPDSDSEVGFVADELASQYERSVSDGTEFSAAVLVRKNRHSAGIAEALEQRGVPYEIVGVAGLLDIPEVADTVAIATMLVRPGDSAAALRVLAGPAVGLGLADLQALADRAANLRARERGGDATEAGGVAGAGSASGSAAVAGPADPVDLSAGVPADSNPAVAALAEQLAELTQRADAIAADAERPAGLADAVADLGEPERYSPEGFDRLRELAAKLRWLRTNSVGKRLTDLFSDIIAVFGIRTEVLARPGVSRDTHLDRLLEEVAAYPGTRLEGLLDYFELARKHEGGFAPGPVAVKTDRVQILSAHKAKGLEWDTVCVLHADSRTYAAKAETFLTNLHVLQEATFGDPDITPAFAEVETRTQFQGAAEKWIASVRADEAEEAARLFYVAVTRSERKLMVTASRTTPGTTQEANPYDHFAELRRIVPEECVVCWADGSQEDGGGEATAGGLAHATAPVSPAPVLSGAAPAEPSESAEPKPELAPGVRVGTWPGPGPTPEVLAAAAAVDNARQELPPLRDGELYGLWERDTTALIEEHESALTADVAVEIPAELTASDVVAMRADPAQFARRARRPVPFKPNTYAKRGTAFHEWLEGFYGARPLLDEDELPGSDEADVDQRTLVQLKEAFEASHWAARTPVFVEHPFELALGDSVVRGRIDAIFQDPDTGGWTVVDWKTGQKPGKAEMEAAKLQLAVYREAWRRIAHDGRPVNAVFFYVRTGEDFAPEHLPGGEELAGLLDPSSAQGWGSVSPVEAASGPGGGDEADERRRR